MEEAACKAAVIQPPMMSLRYRMEVDCGGGGGDPPPFYHDINGTIIGSAEDEREIPIGKIKMVYFDIDLMRAHGRNITDVADEDASNFTIIESICTTNGKFRPAAQKAMRAADDALINHNMLLIHWLEIIPRYRGCGCGKRAITQAIRLFGRACSVVALQAYPLQLQERRQSTSSWRKKMGLQHFPADAAIATKQLRSHYERMGFHLVPGTDIMLLNTDYTSPVCS